MNDKILVYGCGDLAWAQSDGSPDSPFGEDWLTGHFSEALPLDDGGTEAVSLCDEIDTQAGWWPAREPPQVRVEIHHGRRAATAALPAWEDLSARQADRITREIRGSGVLVTPQAWSRKPRGREFLRAWGRLGWRWVALEAVLDRKFPAETRFASACSTWLRIHEPGGSAVVPNGAEASCAQEVAPFILGKVLEAADSKQAEAWHTQEKPRSGWFTRQQIVGRIADALREGRRSVELGGPDAPLFRFSSADASEHFAELAALRITIDLPPLSAAIWWEQIAEPPFLQSPPGTAGGPAFRWEALETILLGNPLADALSSAPEIRSLHTYLRFNGRPLRLIDPVTLTEAIEIGQDLDRCLARWEESERRLAEAVGVSAASKASFPEAAARMPAELRMPSREVASPMAEGAGEISLSGGEEDPGEDPGSAGGSGAPEVRAADPLFAFAPDHIYLEQPHRSVKVRIDGLPLSPENVVPAELAEEKRGYQIPTVPRGAIVRIDFEPEPPNHGDLAEC